MWQFLWNFVQIPLFILGFVAALIAWVILGFIIYLVIFVIVKLIRGKKRIEEPKE